MPTVPEKLTNYNVYKSSGSRFVGLASEITLPNMEQMSEELSGAGIAGSWDSPTPGHFGPMEMEISFRTLTSDAMEVMSSDNYNLTLRAAQQSYDTSAGVEKQRPLKVIIQGRPKGTDLGKIAIGAQTDTKIKLSVSYIKIEENGKVILEYDKFNFIYIVNGVDKMKELKNMI